MENLDHILIFKTNISSETEIQALHTLFDNNPDIESWSIDPEDTDKVLRVISYSLSHNSIIEIINHQGYQCLELI